MTRVVVLIAAIAFGALAGAAKAAADRVALIIGNSAYQHQAPLANPVNDIAAMYETLTGIGYDVTRLENLDEDAMERALADFSEKADEAEIAIVYFSGHGMEISEKNYLIPIDAELKKERDARFEAIDLETVRASIEGAAKLKVVILDACRNNTFLPQTRGGTRGLKRVVAQAGEVIAYSTAPGSVAQDGEPGGLSPYTRALSEKLKESPALDVRFLFTSLGSKTAEYAGVQQRPYTEFASILPDGRLPLGVAPGDPLDGVFEQAIASRDVDRLRELLADDPNHDRAQEAFAIVEQADRADKGRVIDAALRSQDRNALNRALRDAGRHPRAGELQAAIEVHDRIDRAVASLDPGALDDVYIETDEVHPRRAEIRAALRGAIVNETCARFIRYRIACPPEVYALAVARPAIETPQPVVAPQPAPAPEPAPAPQAEVAPAPEPEPEPVDPLAVFLDDAGPASLEKAIAVKIEWRQVALRALGHYRGVVDGKEGPGMRRAIASWREELGVETDGDMTGEEVVALMKLGAEVSAEAEAYLGVMYGIGLGVDLIPAESRRRLSAARDDGVADAGVYLENLSANWSE